MPANFQKWIDLLAKLNALTQDGKITWTKLPSAPQSPTGLGSLISTETFVAPYQDKKFQLSARTLAASKPSLSLEITDDRGVSLVTVPDVVGITDLFESVRLHHSGIAQFLDDFLKD